MIQKKYNCVVLADRNFGLLEGVRGLLDTMFETVVVVADVPSLLESAGRLQPEVAAVEMCIAKDGNLNWMRELRDRCPDLRLIALSVHDEPSVLRAATKAGCDGFVIKRAIAEELLPVVERLLSDRSEQQRRASMSKDNPEE